MHHHLYTYSFDCANATPSDMAAKSFPFQTQAAWFSTSTPSIKDGMAAESEVFRLWEASVLQCECLAKMKMHALPTVNCPEWRKRVNVQMNSSVCFERAYGFDDRQECAAARAA